MLSFPVQKQSKDKSRKLKKNILASQTFFLYMFLIFPSKDAFKSQFTALSDHIEQCCRNKISKLSEKGIASA